MKNKHKYSTIALILIGGIALIAIVSGLGSEDIDEICSDNNQILKRINGTWQCADPPTTTVSNTNQNIYTYQYWGNNQKTLTIFNYSGVNENIYEIPTE